MRGAVCHTLAPAQHILLGELTGYLRAFPLCFVIRVRFDAA
jgi:hypothetical protein